MRHIRFLLSLAVRLKSATSSVSRQVVEKKTHSHLSPACIKVVGMAVQVPWDGIIYYQCTEGGSLGHHSSSRVAALRFCQFPFRSLPGLAESGNKKATGSTHDWVKTHAATPNHCLDVLFFILAHVRVSPPMFRWCRLDINLLDARQWLQWSFLWKLA